MAGTDQLSRVFSALADPTRRAILAELAERDATVTELSAPLPMSMPAVSRHLKVLEEAALISRRRSGKWRASHLQAAPLREAADWIDRFRRFWNVSLDRLDAHLTAVQAEPQLAISRALDAGSVLPLGPHHPESWHSGPSHVELDLVSCVHIHIDLTDVADGDLLEGVMHVTGRLQDDIEPFKTRFRVEFHDEPHGRTRIEIRQWLPAHLAGPGNQGWLEALEKLDATLLHIQAAPTDAEV
jgi:DNA-binding transcriptional ArsR family regulator